MNQHRAIAPLLLLLFPILVISLLAFRSSPSQVSASQPEPTPTINRLAAPTMPPEPGQADEGSQHFWLHCLPCHGDRGQGLTDEFRMLYPEEDRNCWDRGCHGPSPYQNGWHLPDFVPALIGDQLLKQYGSAGGLFAFIRTSMPFQDPGSLTDEQYYAITAFLIRENGLLDLTGPVDASNADALLFPGQPQAQPPTSTPAASPTEEEDGQNGALLPVLIILLAASLLAGLYFGLRAMQRRNR